MIGPKSILEMTYVADGAVPEYRIIKKGANEDDAKQGAAATDVLEGVSQHTVIDNADLRVMLIGISKVEYGGTVTQGDELTSDSIGRAIKATRHTHTENTNATYVQNATTGAGSAERIVGIAKADGVIGDIGRVLLVPGSA